MNQFLAGDGTGEEIDENYLVLLKKLRNNLMKKDLRIKFDDLLRQIDMHIAKISKSKVLNDAIEVGLESILGWINKGILEGIFYLIKMSLLQFEYLGRLGDWIKRKHNLFSGIRSICLSWVAGQMSSDLQSVVQRMSYVRDEMLKGINNSLLVSDVDSDPFKLNILMKAYRDYRSSYEEARADPDNLEMSDEQLHKEVRRFGASVYIKPIRGRFPEFSKSEAWDLLDAIHQMVTRE